MDFVNWIEAELEKREWNRSDLARKSKISQPQITPEGVELYQALQDEQKQADEARRRRDAQTRTINTMRELLPHFHQWIAEDEPTVVKFHLSRVVRLTAKPDKTITAEFL